MANYSRWLDDELELEHAYRRQKKTKTKRSRNDVMAELVEVQDNEVGGFSPTFSASRHEREWIMTYLGPFYEDHVISDVLFQVKGGKEATVYCCQAHPSIKTELLAAKVYRPRAFRTLSNDALYRQGRFDLSEEGKTVRDRRAIHAMQKKTDFGLEMLHASWLSHEVETMRRLRGAGADVPQVYGQGENTILMEYVGDTRQAASTLNHVHLPPAEAGPIFERLLANIEIMLAQERIHGDLSAYNVLYWDGEIKLIDFPQAVDPYKNPHALALLTRDIQRICDYFQRKGITTPHAPTLARRFWGRHVDLDPDFQG